MPYKSSIEIHNELRDIKDKVAKLTDEFNAAEAPEAKDALRDQIMELNGQSKALDSILGDVLAEEDEIRRNGGVPLAGTTQASAPKPKTLGEVLMGPRNAFKGLAPGGKLTMSVADEYTDFSLPSKEHVDYNLPRQTLDYMSNFGVLDTLPTATTDSNIIKYFEADPEEYENAADTWKPGNKKPSSSMGWKQNSCQVEDIAHLIPVLKDNLEDYGQLRSILDVEMMMGLRLKKAEKCLKGSNSQGITGILNNAGIQKYTAKKGDSLADSIRRMKTDAFLGSGYMPTTLAVHPYVSEALELQKDADGRYINVMVNGKIWALQIVEDLNLVSGDTGNEKYGVLAYWPGAATWYTRSTDSLEVGLVGEQFAYNELTLRAEGRHALKVTYPKAFSYLADAGITRA